MNETILKDDPNRYCIFPVPDKYKEVWDFYKKQMACFWTADELDLVMDNRDWITLTNNEQHFIKMVLAYFAASDGIVLENLALRFMKEIKIPEIKLFYGFQIAMENIHSEVYSLLIEQYIKNSEERNKLFKAMETVPIIERKSRWAIK